MAAPDSSWPTCCNKRPYCVQRLHAGSEIFMGNDSTQTARDMREGWLAPTYYSGWHETSAAVDWVLGSAPNCVLHRAAEDSTVNLPNPPFCCASGQAPSFTPQRFSENAAWLAPCNDMPIESTITDDTYTLEQAWHGWCGDQSDDHCLGTRHLALDWLGPITLEAWFAAMQELYAGTFWNWADLIPAADTNAFTEDDKRLSFADGTQDCPDTSPTWDYGAGAARPDTCSFETPRDITGIAVQTNSVTAIVRTLRNEDGWCKYEKRTITTTENGFDGKKIIVLLPDPWETWYIQGVSASYKTVLDTWKSRGGAAGESTYGACAV